MDQTPSPFRTGGRTQLQESSPSPERQGRRLYDSRVVIDRAGSLYLDQGSSPIAGTFVPNTSPVEQAVGTEGADEYDTESNLVYRSRLPDSSRTPIPDLPHAELPTRIAGLEERVQHFEEVLRGEHDHPVFGPVDRDHAKIMLKRYKKQLEEAEANLPFVPSVVEQRIHTLRQAHLFTTTPSDLVNVAGVISAYTSGEIAADSTLYTVFFNGQIVDRIPDLSEFSYAALTNHYQQTIFSNGSLWLEDPLSLPMPLAHSATCNNLPPIHTTANMRYGEHWMIKQTVQLCHPNGYPNRSYKVLPRYPAKPLHPSLTPSTYTALHVGPAISFDFLIDTGATEMVLFDGDLPSLGYRQDITPMLSVTKISTAGGTVHMPKFACFVSYEGTTTVCESVFFVNPILIDSGSRLSGLGMFRDFSCLSMPNPKRKGHVLFIGEEKTGRLVERVLEGQFGKDAKDAKDAKGDQAITKGRGLLQKKTTEGLQVTSKNKKGKIESPKRANKSESPVKKGRESSTKQKRGSLGKTRVSRESPGRVVKRSERKVGSNLFPFYEWFGG